MLGKQLPIPAVASPDVSKQNNRFTCICCRIKFESADLQRAHFKTEWHLYNLKRRVSSLDPVQLADFEHIQANLPLQDDETSTLYAESICDLKLDCPGGGEVGVDDDDWEFLDEDYEEDEIDELLAQAISHDTCLFCDRKSRTVEENLEHMDHVHGFFIPERRYLIDLSGLLEYLGFKVGAGATCLWCNKQFSSLHGVRLHMSYKDHCKIFYDQERAVTEFREFYDYSAQKTFEMKPKGQLSLPTSRLVGRRARPSRALVRTEPSKSDIETLAETKQVKSYRSLEKKSIKKFDAYRAKIALRTVVNGNNTLRERFRAQNPI